MNQLSQDYFLHGIQAICQKKANLLLATTGVLNSTTGNYKLFISSTSVEHESALSFDNVQRFNMIATIIDKDSSEISVIESFGSPNQCLEYIAYEFSTFLSESNDEIFLQVLEEPTYETLLNGKQKMNELCQVQSQVDEWINSIGVRYFNELTNMTNLTEEVGEVARLISREYGEQSFKSNEKPLCIKTAIADELSDVLFIVVCLANQIDIDLGDAFDKNMDKKSERDKSRHQHNDKLN